MNEHETTAMTHAVATIAAEFVSLFGRFLDTDQAISYVYRAEGETITGAIVEIVVSNVTPAILTELHEHVTLRCPVGYAAAWERDYHGALTLVEVTSSGRRYSFYS